MPEEGKVPKIAVKSLMEYCKEQGKKTETSAAEILRDYLQLMKKHMDYFFGEPWPEELDRQFDLSDKDYEFIEEGKDYDDKVGRFTVACLKRSISMDGFDSQRFDGLFDFCGRMACWNCVVPDVVWLRGQIVKIEQSRKEVEEAVKAEGASAIDIKMHAHYTRPEAVRDDKMLQVNLTFFDEFGGVKGKSCTVRNWFKCPYAEESELLVRDGQLVRAMWRLVEWYNDHWNRSLTYTPSGESMRWYHYDEPGIIDVTSYDDIIKAFEDGRMKEIAEEHRRYEKEHDG